MTLASNNQALTEIAVNGRRIVLVGTAHVSRESVALVEQVITAEKPDTVCVELCASRFQSIRRKDQWLEMDIVKVIKEKKTFLLLSNLMLASFQKRIGDKLGVKPGEEMIRALDSAEATGATVCLADRDITITFSRLWRGTGFWNKTKLLYQLLGSVFEAAEIEEKDIEAMKESDMLESLLAEMGKSQPMLREILIDERDRYLAQKIRTAPGETIVAVVGAGHVPGIRRYIEQDTDLSALETLPPKGKLGSVMKWLIPGAIVALIVYGFFQGGAGVGTDMIVYWALVTGVCSGIGAVAAFGHPLSVLSAVAAAPLTTLHPLLAAGWVSGIVEAMVRKPKVRDMESLPEDILSVRGFWRNHVTRILLMVVFTNIGASIGTFVALPMMMNLLGAG